MARYKDTNWTLPTPNIQSWEQAQLAVLMDIRDELKTHNAQLTRILLVLECHNTLDIPRILRRISANTHKLRKPRKPRKPKGAS